MSKTPKQLEQFARGELTALVTGASSGIGKEIAFLLAEWGVNLVLVSRRKERLRELAAEWKNKFNVDVYVIPMDFSLAEAAYDLYDRIKKENLEIDILVNNAGFAVPTTEVFSNPVRAGEMIRVNCSAPANLSNLIAVGMIERGRGWILNVGSVVSFFPIAASLIYGPSKTFLYYFTRNLRIALRKKGIKVSALIPGGTRTGFFKAAEMEIDSLHEKALSAPEVVAEKGLRGMFRGRLKTVPGIVAKTSLLGGQILPNRWLYGILRAKRLKRNKKKDNLLFHRKRSEGERTHTAFITGASSGIGKALASELAAKGYDLIILSRRVERLNDLKKELESQYGVNVDVIGADLSEPGMAEKVYRECRDKGYQVDLLINNAGFGVKTEEELACPSRVNCMMELMMVNLTKLCQSFGRDMLERGYGYILNVGSAAGFFPVGMMRSYGPVKSYILRYSLTLSYELKRLGISVCCLAPGAVRTEFMDAGDMKIPHRLDRFLPLIMASPRRVARAGLRGLFHSRKVVIPGLLTNFYIALSRIIPYNWNYLFFVGIENFRKRLFKKNGN